MSDTLDEQYRETVEIHERDFQLYSIQNRIYFIPVDDVCGSPNPFQAYETCSSQFEGVFRAFLTAIMALNVSDEVVRLTRE